MHAICGQDEKNDEVRDHHGQVKSIGMINAAEGAIRKLVPVVAQRTLLDEHE